MYHITISPVSLCWNRKLQTTFSIIELDEHHIWNDQICFEGYSPNFSSNLGISKGSLVHIEDHVGSWRRGSLMTWNKSSKFKLAIKERRGWVIMFPIGSPMLVLGLWPTLLPVLTLALSPFWLPKNMYFLLYTWPYLAVVYWDMGGWGASVRGDGTLSYGYR